MKTLRMHTCMMLSIVLAFMPWSSSCTLRSSEDDLITQLIKKGITHPYLLALNFYYCKDTETDKIIRICYKLEEVIAQLKDVLQETKSGLQFNPTGLDNFCKEIAINAQKNHAILSDVLKLFQSKDPSIFQLGSILLPIVPVFDNLSQVLQKSPVQTLSEPLKEAIQDAQKAIIAAQNIAGGNLLAKVLEIKKKLEIIKKNYKPLA